MAVPSLYQVEVAVYNALSGSAAIQAFVGNPARIYPHIPQEETTFPYIVHGDVSASPDDDKSTEAVVVFVEVGMQDRNYRGHGRLLQLADAVYDLLHRGTLSITGNQHVLTRFEGFEDGRDEDGLTYWAVARFAVLVRES